MARTRYQVTPDPDTPGSWLIQVDGTPIASYEDKDEAVQEAAAQARDDFTTRGEHTQLLIHTADGRIQDERTYGDDPPNIPG